MNGKEFIDTFGVTEATRVAEDAGTNYAYFSQIAYGHKCPSGELAVRLVESSNDRLDLKALLTSRANSAA